MSSVMSYKRCTVISLYGGCHLSLISPRVRQWMMITMSWRGAVRWRISRYRSCRSRRWVYHAINVIQLGPCRCRSSTTKLQSHMPRGGTTRTITSLLHHHIFLWPQLPWGRWSSSGRNLGWISTTRGLGVTTIRRMVMSILWRRHRTANESAVSKG